MGTFKNRIEESTNNTIKKYLIEKVGEDYYYRHKEEIYEQN